ncbi:hypothetical protein N0M98_22980 [Paenibacillus doosanensis]|uniref:Uncharacterized protein n=1 Tax=Paenibacillus konkukensis TaxID=2020716 RepID=A0ABY4RNA3_9BACL|nr:MULTISPECIES: hypothetical protein [Paenibacillus]MCS7462995.1 hypothetical protein [Paenibacillus doosanensis]UQZ83901.1 hypothetical protein SK3146_03108 [Paenibacillus konkukensis]
MILYELAKRLEQRQQLQRTIRQSAGDREQLISQKAQVEEQLTSLANMWSDTRHDEWVPGALIADADQMEQQSTWS